MSDASLRLLHIACALLSGAGFLGRGLLMWRASPLLQARWVRTLPHVNDTVLLGAAVALAWQSGQTPWTHAWLGAKIIGLLAYIGLGMLALRRAKSRNGRLMAFVGALAVFAWMLSVARLRHPAGFFALL